MKPLLVLIIVFGVSLGGTKVVRDHYDAAISARIALSAMLIFTAIAHFIFTNGMSMMLPDFIPYKSQVVYFTGVIEIAAAIGLFIPSVRVVTAWLLILFFILILPANIYAALKKIDYQTGKLDGNGLTYLWFRIPLQILFIALTYFSAIRE